MKPESKTSTTPEFPEATSRDLVTAAVAKEAGITVYLMEELTDARLRCEQLKKFVAQAVRLVAQSSHRDHFYEVAGDVIYGLPDSLFKLDKALAATALAASRLDYEELKSQLKPEKVTELEDVLRNVRLRQIDRRAPFIQPIPETSAVPTNQPQGKTAMYKAASTNHIASALRRIASDVEAARISPKEASLRLNRIKMALSQTAQEAVEAMGNLQANSREEVMKGFKSANPDLTDDQLEEIADQWEKNKDVVKDKSAAEGDIPEGVKLVPLRIPVEGDLDSSDKTKLLTAILECVTGFKSRLTGPSKKVIEQVYLGDF